MFQPKLALTALTLEASAWGSLLLGSSSDHTLLLFLLAHAGASALIALAAQALLPARLATPRLPVFLFLFGTGFVVPVLGFAAVAGGVFFLRTLAPRSRQDSFGAIELPEIDVHQGTGKGFRQAGMRAFLANTRAPVASRLRALVALQNVSGRVASPLLRNVLADPSDDIRLLAYGMLDKKEKLLNEAIHQQAGRLRRATEGSAEHLDAARKLAELYWELVYQELTQGDLRAHALQQSLTYTTLALARAPDDAALHLRHGRLLQSLGQPHAARAAYHRALELGMPKIRIVPYLAEAAYDLSDYAGVSALMQELADWQSLPRLRPVIAYWNRT